MGPFVLAEVSDKLYLGCRERLEPPLPLAPVRVRPWVRQHGRDEPERNLQSLQGRFQKRFVFPTGKFFVAPKLPELRQSKIVIVSRGSRGRSRGNLGGTERKRQGNLQFVGEFRGFTGHVGRDDVRFPI